jgi:glycosyltransferase involved in cell wall biosynthesis
MYFNGVYVLNIEPLIISFIGNYPFNLESVYQGVRLNKTLPQTTLPNWFRPKHILEHLPGWAAPLYRMTQFKTKQILHSFEGKTHHLMVNALDEETMREGLFVRGAHFSHNIYINENLYKPLNEPRIYDAIYTAQLATFKRHWLAKQVERLMIVSYGGDLHEFCPELKHAEFNKEFIPRTELARKYNQAYSGLCLSAKEGAMFASCEYLFCGIPVVSTPSKGGRDIFFSQQNSIIVPPDPAAVAQAVQHWKQNPPDPHEIREETLRKIRSMRKEYCTYIAKLIDQEGGGKKEPETLMEKYFAPPNGIASRFIRFDELGKITLEALSLKML